MATIICYKHAGLLNNPLIPPIYHIIVLCCTWSNAVCINLKHVQGESMNKHTNYTASTIWFLNYVFFLSLSFNFSLYIFTHHTHTPVIKYCLCIMFLVFSYAC